MSRPTFSSIYTQLATGLSERSTCSRSKVGCVITSTDSRYVYGIGYNGGASGMADCCTGEVGNCGCLHAEMNAVINCNADRTKEKIVYTTLVPCMQCAKALINLGGVQKVIYSSMYRKTDGLELLQAAGIKCLSYEDIKNVHNNT